MCGRFNLTATPEQVKEAFNLPSLFDFQPNYNINPGQDILAVVPSDEAIDGNRYNQAVQLFWGLIPSWSKDRKISQHLINARAETIAEKPSFRSAFANQLMQPIHSRMPVIIGPKNYQHWLDGQTKKDVLQALLALDAYSAMDIIPVSNWVNNPRHNDDRCIRPLS
jgi:putative SOS response-associated peptidase YedK